MQLRPHQNECINAIKNSFRKGRKRALVKAPCSFGKTIVFCEIARLAFLKANKVLVVVDNVALVKQTYDKMVLFIPDSHVGIYCSSLNRYDDHNLITVSTVQSIRNTESSFDILIFDECHDGIVRLNNLANRFKESYVVGFTATPFNAKGVPIYGEDRFYTDLAYAMSVKKMIELDFITPMIYGSEPENTKIDLKNVDITMGDFNEEQLQAAYNLQEDKVRLQINDMLSRIKGRDKIIIMCTGIAHAELVQQILGDHAIAYHSEVSISVRREMLKHFELGDIKFLVGVMAIYKGLDIPIVDCLVNMRPTRSKSFYVQFAGRGVRKFSGKKDCLFLDYGQTVENLGFYEDIQEKEIKKGGKGEPPTMFPKKCPECNALVTPQTRFCACGYAFPFNLLANTTEVAFNAKSLSPQEIISPFISFETKDTTGPKGSMTAIKINIKDPNQIPQNAKGSKYAVNFYYVHALEWQQWEYKKIKSKLEKAKDKILIWKLNNNGWPTFVDAI